MFGSYDDIIPRITTAIEFSTDSYEGTDRYDD